MIATNLLFLEPSELRLLGPRRREAHARRSAADGAAPPAADEPRAAARAMGAAQPGRWALAAAATLLAMQLVLPLRPLLASGLDPLDAVSAAPRTPHRARRTPDRCMRATRDLVGRCTPSRTRSSAGASWP